MIIRMKTVYFRILFLSIITLLFIPAPNPVSNITVLEIETKQEDVQLTADDIAVLEAFLIDNYRAILPSEPIEERDYDTWFLLIEEERQIANNPFSS